MTSVILSFMCCKTSPLRCLVFSVCIVLAHGARSALFFLNRLEGGADGKYFGISRETCDMGVGCVVRLMFCCSFISCVKMGEASVHFSALWLLFECEDSLFYLLCTIFLKMCYMYSAYIPLYL